MKKNKIFLFFLVLSVFNSIYCQNKTFKYDFEYKPNVLRDSTILEKTVLDVKDDNLSIFRTEQEKISDSLIASTGLGSGRKMRFEDQFYVKKNLSKNEVFKSIQTMFREIFFIKINEELDWKILPEKNMIGTFNVQKATVNYGGRNWTAWFTIEIPIQNGPYIFYGLPGLIIKISDAENNFIFSLTEIKDSGKDVYYRTKGSEITWEQFKKLSENYYSDPLARVKSMGVPFKINDGNGNPVSVDMKLQADRMKKIIREDNNPIEFNHKIKYE
ncbi:GLPGLI family protein [Chryseobacterium sp. Leaf201]|uniref:GLPGLI family protein n=1 Tax=Chryseobacterium sp. Leaf201 TaxID=1735672 RepID=UPI0006F9704A|nr:GLPGLI family protein [Chryseobacterium sp. Leaf201]KQM37462.1 hypothetical protein ASE55_14865 [Chryseobacterium sp. Leaf201]